MNLDDRFDNIRRHARRRHHIDFAEFERDLDELQAAVRHETQREAARFLLLQAELAELLRRTPDRTPVTITVTAH